LLELGRDLKQIKKSSSLSVGYKESAIQLLAKVRLFMPKLPVNQLLEVLDFI